MKRLIFAIAAAFVLSAAADAPAAKPADKAKRPPNVVLILIDDMGWQDLGCTGNTFIETPAIDALAAKGQRFTQAYASAPNCAPTRGCLMSGQYTPRHGVYTVVDPRQPVGAPWHKLLAADSKSDMPTEVVTVAETLKARGYATAMFGMWNLGRGKSGPTTPTGQGFDIFKDPKDIGFEKDAYQDAQGQQLCNAVTDQGLAFIKSKKDQPFFLYLPYHDIHAPFNPRADLLAKYEKKKAAMPADAAHDPAYAATVENLDDNIARLVKFLKDEGLADNTILLFTSDNGATKPFCSPLRGSKGELYEGGIRVPMIAYVPGFTQAGSICETPVSSVDIHPTLIELSGATAPKQPLDGKSLLPLFKRQTFAQRPIYWHFPCYIGSSKPSSALRLGDWKLLEFFEDDHIELYNLKDDPAESKNLASTDPARAKAMLDQLHAWQKDTGAICPHTANPAYDPKASRPKGNSKFKIQDSKFKMERNEIQEGKLKMNNANLEF
ncbi:MAG: hypothetical protein RL095_4167 [Verrucomicrobiota bacterium]|jgi:arylsulfatase A-like enzyme